MGKSYKDVPTYVIFSALWCFLQLGKGRLKDFAGRES